MTLARLAAGITALACLVIGTLSLTGPPVPDENWGTRGAVINAVGLVAFAATTLAVQLLPPLLALGRIGGMGCRIAQAGLALMVVESAASQIHEGNTLGPVFMLGLLLTLVGLILVAVDGLRRRRWLAPLPFVALLVAIGSGDHGGFLALTLTWAAIAAINPGQSALATS